jgi:hypothetical protein
VRKGLAEWFRCRIVGANPPRPLRAYFEGIPRSEIGRPLPARANKHGSAHPRSSAHRPTKKVEWCSSSLTYHPRLQKGTLPEWAEKPFCGSARLRVAPDPTPLRAGARPPLFPAWLATDHRWNGLASDCVTALRDVGYTSRSLPDLGDLR